MVHVKQHPKARCKTTLEVICSKVRKIVVQTLETVILNMKYKPYETLQVSSEQPFELAFSCNLEDSHSDHFMMVTKEDSGHHAKCLKSRVDFDLEDRHLIWFMVSIIMIMCMLLQMFFEANDIAAEKKVSVLLTVIGKQNFSLATAKLGGTCNTQGQIV